MTTQELPPREWEIHDLRDLGKKSNVTWLKAIPVLILEEWVKKGREEGVANFVRTKPLASRIEKSGLHPPFKPKATSVVLGALRMIQKFRNLTRPPLLKLIEPKSQRIFRVSLPHYEELLQEYRQKYREDHPEDYKKLFPEGEPEWEPPSAPRAQTRRGGAEPALAESEVQDEIQGLLAPIEEALRNQQQAVERLTEENQKLQAEVASLQYALQSKHQAPRQRIVDGELRDDCEEFLKREDTYIDAVRRAGVVLEERLRRSIGGNGPERFKAGVDLVDYALLPDSGKLVISDHPAEQQGVRMLFRGALQFVRNPPSHKKIRYTETEARQAIGLIDYLLLLLQLVRARE